MSNIIRHQSDARLARAVIHNGVVYLAGITADNRGGIDKAQTEEILAQDRCASEARGQQQITSAFDRSFVADMRVKPGMDEA